MYADSRRFNLTAALSRRSPVLLGFMTVGLFAAVTALRFYTHPEFSFSFLYLIPVSFSAWFLSPRSGIFLALVATAALVIFDFSQPGRYPTREIAFWDIVMNLGIFLFFIFVLGELRELYGRERERSLTDPLTSLLNRRAFTEAVDLERQRVRRTLRPLTVVYVDLDYFKRINDEQGHAAGDALLRDVAECMLASVRSIDSVARLGGDEFSLLLPETGAEEARAAVTKLQQHLQDAMQLRRWSVTFSIGAVTFQSPADSAEAMIAQADRLMYEVKQSGKNRFEHRTVASTEAA